MNAHTFLPNDRFVLLLILINAAIIFFGGFEQESSTARILLYSDHLLTLFFVYELSVKLIIYGKSFFRSSWNNLDLLLVLLSVPSIIILFTGAAAFDLSYLLVLRVLRVFKTLRFLRFIPGIDHLMRGFIRAAKASVLVLVGFFIYIFIIGIFSFYLYKDISVLHFGDPLRSLYSTFKIFTIEGWFDIPEAVCEALEGGRAFLTYLYFIFVVLSGGIIGLSLVNSIFVDAMISDNTDDIQAHIDRLEKKIDYLTEKLVDSDKKE
jgi:voltage-gated sodium channel